jgi:anaerobic magnesium-protoporphyrin IX monomethyl ester cyclase
MKCVLVAIGWENIALQALSALLKENGHEVHLVYDQALFDDKNYLSIPWMAKILDQKDLVIQRIIELEPDLVGFHVQTVQYHEMRDMAQKIKQHYNVPIIFGGIHPHSSPDKTLLKEDPAVDMICLSDGEYPLLELCNSIDEGKINYSIKNIWFRLEDESLIKNETRPLVEDIDDFPTIDKELFAPHVSIKNSYLSTPSRGCPFVCNFCSLSFLGAEAKRLGGARVRERSVDSLIKEVKDHVDKYKSEWVDFRQPVMASSKSWTVEFFKKYKDEIGLPFRCFTHPYLVNKPAIQALRDAGCFAVQMGVECWDEEVRNVIINRSESNEDIKNACHIFEKVGQPYALDYILGLPRAPIKLSDGSTRPMTPEETLESYNNELMGFTEFVSELKYCYRIAPFMIQYMPGTNLIEHGLAAGDLSNEEIERIKDGFHGNYMAEGSVSIAPKKLRLLQGYRVMLRLMSFLSPWSKKLLLKLKLYKIFWMAPFRVFITVLDLMIAARDEDATTYVKHYWWWFKKRFDKNYHLYMFKKRKKYEVLSEGFQLPLDGVLGTKTGSGWKRILSKQKFHFIASDKPVETTTLTPN